MQINDIMLYSHEANKDGWPGPRKCSSSASVEGCVHTNQAAGEQVSLDCYASLKVTQAHCRSDWRLDRYAMTFIWISTEGCS